MKSNKAGNWRRWILWGLLALVIVIQLIPVERGNPPVETTIGAPEAVMAILRSACYDCHSNESHWPWYSYVAPVSWLIAHDVEEGREHLNFSTWNRFSDKDRVELREEIWEEVEEGEMPLAIYLPLHPEAELSESQKATLRSWALGSAHSGNRDARLEPSQARSGEEHQDASHETH